MWPASTTLLNSNALKWWPCRGPPQPQATSVLRSAHLCYRLFLADVIRLYRKMIFWRIFCGKYCQNLPKICMNIFRLVANKGLIWTVITTSRIRLFAWAIFLYGNRCNMYMIYCLNYILNEWEVKLKNTKFFDKVFQHNIFLNKRIWIIRYFQTHCQLSKFPIRDMPFKTKCTALVNSRGLTDSAWLIIIRITAATLRAITDLKLFLGGV